MDRITSKDNALIKEISILNSNGKKRRELKKFLAEGLRVCNEALSSDFTVERVVVSDGFLSKYKDYVLKLEENNLRVTQITDDLFQKIADTKTPQGIMCICLEKSFDNYIPDIERRYLALENISDPSNMGTIIRTADALNVSAIIASSDCCDAFSPKCVRGSMGGIFRISFISVPEFQKYIKMLNSAGFTTYASVLSPDACYINDVKFKNGSVILVGNEGNGLTKETVDLCSRKIMIPMNPCAQSLNAAAAASIMMWEMMK